MTHMLQVNPDLVSTAGVKLQAEKVDGLESCDYVPIGPSAPAAGRDDHALPVLWMTHDGGIDPNRAFVEVTPGESGVAPPNPPSGNGSAQAAVGQVGLGDDHQSGRVPVQPMHDSRSSLCPAR
jgi:hypothetical protein